MINLSSPVVRHIEGTVPPGGNRGWGASAVDEWSVCLRADGLGEAKVPADFNPDHIEAVQAAIGARFELLDPEEYRRREGRWVFLGVAPAALTVPPFRR